MNCQWTSIQKSTDAKVIGFSSSSATPQTSASWKMLARAFVMLLELMSSEALVFLLCKESTIYLRKFEHMLLQEDHLFTPESDLQKQSFHFLIKE